MCYELVSYWVSQFITVDEVGRIKADAIHGAVCTYVCSIYNDERREDSVQESFTFTPFIQLKLKDKGAHFNK